MKGGQRPKGLLESNSKVELVIERRKRRKNVVVADTACCFRFLKLLVG
jgi:hypothetical protein